MSLGTLLKINGEVVPGIKSYEVLPEKLYKSTSGNETGRDLNGNLHLNFIGVCPKIQITLRNGLGQSDIARIVRILSKSSFTAEYYDPILGRNSSGQYYANTPTIGILSKKRELYQEFKFNIIPLSPNGEY